MSCKLYINEYSSNPEVVEKLGEIQDRITDEIEKTGYFEKVGNKYYLPPTDTVRYDSAEDAINIINRQFGAHVVGINTSEKKT